MILAPKEMVEALGLFVLAILACMSGYFGLCYGITCCMRHCRCCSKRRRLRCMASLYQAEMEQLAEAWRALPDQAPGQSMTHYRSVYDRYRDIRPYTHNHVNAGLAEKPYVNASRMFAYVDSFGTEARSASIGHSYFTGQAPMQDNQFVGFWDMVWSNRITTIVMLTNFKENGLPKAELYWPGKEGEVLVNNEYQVKNLGHVLVCEGILKDKLMVTFLQLHPCSAKTTPQDALFVCHIHYIGWPDGSTPDPDELREVMRIYTHYRGFAGFTSHDMFAEDLYPNVLQAACRGRTHFVLEHSRNEALLPCWKSHLLTGTLVHCSAGVNRSGLFLAVLREMDKHTPGKCVTPTYIKELVTVLRKDRVVMLTQLSFWVFLRHYLVNEYHLSKPAAEAWNPQAQWIDNKLCAVPPAPSPSVS